LSVRLRRRRHAIRVAATSVLLSVVFAAHADPLPLIRDLEASGYLDGLAVVETRRSRKQLPQALGEVWFGVALTEHVRGHLSLRGQVGGPYVHPTPNVLGFVHAFQNASPYLEFSEAYLGVDLGPVDARIGVQKFAWGKLDGIAPTDVINPLDYHDPFVRDLAEAKMGVPAAALTWNLPYLTRLRLRDLAATLIYVPFAVPARLPLTRERWFPEAARRASRVTLPRERIERFLEEELNAPVTVDPDVPAELRTENQRPPKRLDAGGLALRLGGMWRGVDWDLYEYIGPDTGPNGDLRATALLQHLAIGPDEITLGLRSRSTVKQATDRVMMTGVDLATEVGSVTFRGEAAAFHDRPYLTAQSEVVRLESLSDAQLRRIARNLVNGGHSRVPVGELFPALDSVEWGTGADYTWRGWFGLLQVAQVFILDAAPRLVVADPETRMTASIRKTFRAERLTLEARGIYTIDRGGWFFFPRASYLVREGLRLQAGYLAIGGSRNSLIGQFGTNDEFVVQLRYYF